MKIANRTWLISDTHFGHKNIIKFQGRPESHEVIMLSEWIKYVREDEDILHLGDVFMGKDGNPARWAAVVSRLPGNKFLILGNHDKQKRDLYERAGFTIIPEFVRQGVAFTHRPISVEFPGPTEGANGIGVPWHTNIHGHTHQNIMTPSTDPSDHDGHLISGKVPQRVCRGHRLQADSRRVGLSPVGSLDWGVATAEPWSIISMQGDTESGETPSVVLAPTVRDDPGRTDRTRLLMERASVPREDHREVPSKRLMTLPLTANDHDSRLARERSLNEWQMRMASRRVKR